MKIVECFIYANTYVRDHCRQMFTENLVVACILIGFLVLGLSCVICVIFHGDDMEQACEKGIGGRNPIGCERREELHFRLRRL